MYCRRKFLRYLQNAVGAGMVAPYLLNNKAFANVTSSKKILQIFLLGGWDTGLATDPIVGSKASSSTYATAYQNYKVEAVEGKGNLLLGEGLIPAKNAFSRVPTCFINGMHIEVTAHELAQNYVYSGVNSLSRSREFPAMVARIGHESLAFPSFVAIGEPVPLGITRDKPPLHTQSPDQLNDMLNPFAESELPAGTIGIANATLANINDIYSRQQNAKMINYLRTWENSQLRLNELYDRNYQLKMDAEILARYSVDNPWEQGARIPAAYLVLKSGLSPFVTCSINGFDTHDNHFSKHIPLMQGFSQRLQTLIADMESTQDPDDTSKSLLESTSIIILSEFARTPTLNAAAGTDHWQSGSAILMGQDFKDNLVIGKTDDEAQPMGWDGQAVARTDETKILPEHLARAIVGHYSPDADLSELGEKSLDEIFSK